MSNIHRANMACVLLPHIQTPAIDGKPTTATSSDIIAATHIPWLVGWSVSWLAAWGGEGEMWPGKVLLMAGKLNICMEGSPINVGK